MNATKKVKPVEVVEDTMLARIHPYNPQRGYTAQTYMVSGSGYPGFEVEMGWYQVSLEMAERIREIRNNEQDPMSPFVFQVCTQEEAEAMDTAEERRRAEAKAPIRMPGQSRPASMFKRNALEQRIAEKLAPKQRYRESTHERAYVEAPKDEPIKPVSPETQRDLDRAFSNRDDEQDPAADLDAQDATDEPTDENPIEDLAPPSPDLTTADLRNAPAAALPKVIHRASAKAPIAAPKPLKKK